MASCCTKLWRWEAHHTHLLPKTRIYLSICKIKSVWTNHQTAAMNCKTKKTLLLSKGKPNYSALLSQYYLFSFQLMESCWAYEPSDRPTFSDVHAKLLSLSALHDSGISHISIGKNLTQINVVHPDVVDNLTTNSQTKSDKGYLQPIQSWALSIFFKSDLFHFSLYR